jgi:RPA family protein
MENFKRLPTIRMLAAELIGTVVELQSGQKDSYQPTIYLSPTGAEVNRVLIAGTAVEKEDVGSDNSFWRVRVADPTGAIFVYAGQYQPEAAKAIQKIEVPSFLIVSGKLSHYTPEQGGETIVSIRAESIATVSLELRDHALADIAMHTARRILDAKTNKNVQCYYGNYDFGSLAKSLSVLLEQVIEDSPPAGAAPPATAAPPIAKTAEPPKPPEVKPPEPPKQPPVPPSAPPVKEPEKPAKGDEKGVTGDKKKKATKKDAPKGPAEPAKEVPKEVPGPAKPEPPKEAPKASASSNVLDDSEKMVLDILKTHKPQGTLAKDTIANVLRALGYAMLNVDGILAKLKSAGEIIEPKDGFYRAV